MSQRRQGVIKEAEEGCSGSQWAEEKNPTGPPKASTQAAGRGPWTELGLERTRRHSDY